MTEDIVSLLWLRGQEPVTIILIRIRMVLLIIVTSIFMMNLTTHQHHRSNQLPALTLQLISSLPIILPGSCSTNVEVSRPPLSPQNTSGHLTIPQIKGISSIS